MDVNRFTRSPIICLAVVTLVALTWGTPTFCGEIHDAAAFGDLEKVKAQLNGNPNLALSEDNLGLTPLHWAALKGHKDMAELLRQNGGLDAATGQTTTRANAPSPRAARKPSPELPFEVRGFSIAPGGTFSTDANGIITRSTGMSLKSLHIGKPELEIPLQSTTVSSDNMMATKDYGNLQIQVDFSSGSYLILVTPEQEEMFKSLCHQNPSPCAP